MHNTQSPLTEKIFNVALGSVIKAERRDQDMQQKELSRRTGIRSETISKCESGIAGAKIYKLHLICKALRVDTGDMIQRAFDLIEKTRKGINNDTNS